MQGSEKTAGQEWREHWPLVFAALLGVTWMAAPATSLGLFLKTLHDSFGWSIAEISAGMMIYAIVGTPLMPFAGALFDRFGPRRLALPGIALNGLAFAAFGLLTPSYASWVAAWIAYTLTQLLIRSIVWNGAVSSAFSASRGLALGVTMGGVAVAQTTVPIFSRLLIDNFGWREAYAIFGIGGAAITLVVAFMFFRSPCDRVQARSATNSDAPPPPEFGGLTLGQAFRDQRIIRIAVALMLQTSLFSGISVHLYHLLTSSEISTETAAYLTAMIGLAGVAGQLATGWLADRTRSGWLPPSCVLLAALGYFLLLQGRGSEALLALGVLLAGYAFGATMNITTYLTTRYGGMRNFGKIYGIPSSCMGLGSGVGPMIAGRIFDQTQSYALYLVVAMSAAVVAALALFRLGRYPDFEAPAPALPEATPAARPA
jgi:predicted MFS family arabinose efflux permease